MSVLTQGTTAPGIKGPGLLAAVLAVLALCAGLVHLVPAISAALDAVPEPGTYSPERAVLLFSTLPRLAMAVLCGGALAASGAILQQALRNPLASPTTLGIDAGARLALALAILVAPALVGWGRDLVALMGSALAAVLVFALSRRQDFAPVPLVLSGLIVCLYCGALSAVLVLVNDRYLVSLFIWGGGSLSQQSWDPALGLGLRLAVLVVPATLLVRPLGLLDLGDEAARGLGLPVSALRIAAVALAVLLSAFTVSAVGVIGFVGLVAPILARLTGARDFHARLLWSTVIGALLLLLTDLGVQILAGATADFLPTGAVTAVIGSPILLWLLPRLSADLARPVARRGERVRVEQDDRARILLGVAGLGFLFGVALFFGRAPGGLWHWLSPVEWVDILPWRWPRILGVAAAGGLLAIAGFVLQRLTGNEMASPEILGISAGATFAVAISLFVFAAVSPVTQFLVATAGSLAVLVAILWFGRRSGFAPERVLLAGIALNALLDAVVGVLSASGDPRAVQLLAWMGGSASTIRPNDAFVALAFCALAVVLGLLMRRWLNLLPLGAGSASSLGVPLAQARLLMLLLVAGTTAAATPLVGPLTFVGLIAPHVVRLSGFRRPALALAASALAGAGILVAADWVARFVAYPFQLPTGLVASLVGAPFLFWLLQRRDPA